MRYLPFAGWLFLAASHATHPQRAIERCAQDGTYFYALNDDPSKSVQAEKDGVGIRIEHTDRKNDDVVITFSEGDRVVVQNHADFDAALGWLTVSQDRGETITPPSRAFAVTWKENASSAESQLFRVASTGELAEDMKLIPLAQKAFTMDAKRICRNPGLNTTAIKWMDDDHLLIAINAWASGFCYSNFTEGFVFSLSKNKIEKKLSGRELIDLPAVCTWNLVPISSGMKKTRTGK